MLTFIYVSRQQLHRRPTKISLPILGILSGKRPSVLEYLSGHRPPVPDELSDNNHKTSQQCGNCVLNELSWYVCQCLTVYPLQNNNNDNKKQLLCLSLTCLRENLAHICTRLDVSALPIWYVSLCHTITKLQFCQIAKKT